MIVEPLIYLLGHSNDFLQNLYNILIQIFCNQQNFSWSWIVKIATFSISVLFFSSFAMRGILRVAKDKTDIIYQPIRGMRTCINCRELTSVSESLLLGFPLLCIRPERSGTKIKIRMKMNQARQEELGRWNPFIRMEKCRQAQSCSSPQPEVECWPRWWGIENLNFQRS